MNWIAGSRLHFFEPLVTRTLVLILAFILSIAKEPLTVYIVFAGFQAGLIHSNIRWDLGPLKYVCCSPRYHHWHHLSDDAAIDKNYVAHLPAIDWISAHSTCRGTAASGRENTARRYSGT